MAPKNEKVKRTDTFFLTAEEQNKRIEKWELFCESVSKQSQLVVLRTNIKSPHSRYTFMDNPSPKGDQNKRKSSKSQEIMKRKENSPMTTNSVKTIGKKTPIIRQKLKKMDTNLIEIRDSLTPSYSTKSTNSRSSLCQTNAEVFLENNTPNEKNITNSTESTSSTTTNSYIDALCETSSSIDSFCQTDIDLFTETNMNLSPKVIAIMKDFCESLKKVDKTAKLSNDQKTTLLNHLVQIVILRNESKILQDGFFDQWGKLCFEACGIVPITADEIKMFIKKSMALDNIESINRKIEKDMNSNLGNLLLKRKETKNLSVNGAILKEWTKLTQQLPLKDVVLYSRYVLKK